MHLFSEWKRKKQKKKTDKLKGRGGVSSRTAGLACRPAETSSIVQAPGKVLSSSPNLPKATPPSPGSSTQPTASDTVPLPPSVDFSAWTRAYEMLGTREPELMGDYKKHLASLQGNSATETDLLTSRSIESIVKQLLDDREKKQWRFSLLGKEVKIREQSEKLVKFLLWSDPVVKSALSTQPYAALAWSGVSLLLPLLTSSTSNNEAMLKGFNLIDDILIYWEIFENTYFQSSHQQDYQGIMEPLAKLYSHLIEYQARAICHLSKAQLSRAWQNVDGSTSWSGKAADIDNLNEHCCNCIPLLEAREIRSNRDSRLQSMQESQGILNEIQIILEAGRNQAQMNYEDHNERNLLQDLASDYEDYKDFNRQKVSGTCEWFFIDDRFRKWRDSNTSSLLWVSAGPGCGKSVLSRALIDERRLSTNVTTSTICYFFFKDGDERRMDTKNALCAILHQLFTHNPDSSLIRHALPSHKNYGKGLAQNFSEMWRILMACADSPNTGEIICVVDALDECSADSRQQLIHKLEEFYCQPQRSFSPLSRLKFLITSRPYDDLEASFRSFSNETAFLRFDGDEKSIQISEEINLVIDARINEIARDFEEADRRVISERLKSIEHRTYLWLHLTLDIIAQSPSEYGRRSDVEGLFSGLPSTVFNAYEKILDRSKNRTVTETLLQIVLAAVWPLSLDEANMALTLALEKQPCISYADLESKLWPRNNFESTVKNLCGLFIMVHESKLSFIHQTARAFLIHPNQEGNWKGHFNMHRSHSKMTMVCLSYLSCLGGHRLTGKTRLQYPLAWYSGQVWMNHARSVEAVADVQERILNFFLHERQAYTMWAKVLDRENVANYPVCLHKKMPNPLYYASREGLQHTVEQLLKKGVNVTAQGGRYGTVLQAASIKGYKEIILLLLEHGANVNAQGGRYGTVLQAASIQGYKEIILLLLEHGANVNAQGGIHGNALQAASIKGYKEIILLLLEHGANVNAQGGIHGNALRAACERGYKDIVLLLLEKGANVNSRGGRHGTVLQYAFFGGINKEIAELLLEKGTNVNTQGEFYCDALQAASQLGYKKIVQLLLEKGSNVNSQSEFYGNALQAACERGYKDIVLLLLEKGANVNSRGGMYYNPLQGASEAGHKEIVQLLLEKGANINAQGGFYGTALQAASIEGYKEIVQLLLENGANVNADGGFYDNALEAAFEEGHKEIVQLLIDKGANVHTET